MPKERKPEKKVADCKLRGVFGINFRIFPEFHENVNNVCTGFPILWRCRILHCNCCIAMFLSNYVWWTNKKRTKRFSEAISKVFGNNFWVLCVAKRSEAINGIVRCWRSCSKCDGTKMTPRSESCSILKWSNVYLIVVITKNNWFVSFSTTINCLFSNNKLFFFNYIGLLSVSPTRLGPFERGCAFLQH